MVALILNHYRGLMCLVGPHEIAAGQMMRVVVHEGNQPSEYLCAPHVANGNWRPRPSGGGGGHTVTYVKLGRFAALEQTYQAQCSCGRWSQTLADGHGTSLHVARNAATLHLALETSPAEIQREFARGDC